MKEAHPRRHAINNCNRDIYSSILDEQSKLDVGAREKGVHFLHTFAMVCLCWPCAPASSFPLSSSVSNALTLSTASKSMRHRAPLSITQLQHYRCHQVCPTLSATRLLTRNTCSKLKRSTVFWQRTGSQMFFMMANNDGTHFGDSARDDDHFGEGEMRLPSDFTTRAGWPGASHVDVTRFHKCVTERRCVYAWHVDMCMHFEVSRLKILNMLQLSHVSLCLCGSTD